MKMVKNFLAVLIIGIMTMSVGPKKSMAFGIPSIDVQGLVQAVKRAITDVQNSSELAWATKSVKGVQSALGKYNDAMNGFIKNNITDRLAVIKDWKDKYDEKVKALKDNKWYKKGKEALDTVKEAKKLYDRGQDILKQANDLKSEAEKLQQDATQSYNDAKALGDKAVNIKNDAEALFTKAKEYAEEGPRLLEEGQQTLEEANDLIKQAQNSSLTKEDADALYNQGMQKKEEAENLIKEGEDYINKAKEFEDDANDLLKQVDDIDK